MRRGCGRAECSCRPTPFGILEASYCTKVEDLLPREAQGLQAVPPLSVRHRHAP